MNKNSKSILEDIEKMIIENYYPHEKIGKYIEVIKICEEKSDQNKANEIRNELNLLNRPLGVAGQITDIWKWCKENLNQPFPEWEKKSVDYYKKRLDETDNPLHKARYAYAIWTFERDINYAQKAVEYFLRTGKRCINGGLYEGKWDLVTFCFEFATKLSLALNLQQPLDITSVLENTFSAIDTLQKNGEMGKMMVDLVGVVASLAENIVRRPELRENQRIREIIKKVMKISNEIANYWHKEKSYHWQQSYLKESVKLVKFLGEHKRARDFLIKIAESLVEEGRSKSANKFVESFFYEEALKIYFDLGMSQKVDELKAKIRECLREAVKRGEFKEVSVPIEVPVPDFVKGYTEKLQEKKPEEILQTILNNCYFIPNKKQVIKTVESIKQQFPLSFVFPRKEIERDAPRRTFTEETQIFELKVKRQFNIEPKVRELLLHGLFKELFKEKVGAEDILAFLKKGKNISENNFKLLEAGIWHHFRENYVASIHILTPQIEEMLRNLLVNHRVVPTKYVPTDEGIEEKLLGGLIKKAKDILGEDFSEYLEVRLTPSEANIRHKVCHGWMRFEEFTENLSLVLIYIILKLSDI